MGPRDLSARKAEGSGIVRVCAKVCCSTGIHLRTDGRVRTSTVAAAMAGFPSPSTGSSLKVTAPSVASRFAAAIGTRTSRRPGSELFPPSINVVARVEILHVDIALAPSNHASSLGLRVGRWIDIQIRQDSLRILAVRVTAVAQGRMRRDSRSQCAGAIAGVRRHPGCLWRNWHADR